MRGPLFALLVAIPLLAGCTSSPSGPDWGPSPIEFVDDVCDLGVCIDDGSHMNEVDIQENAVPLLTFHEDFVAAVNAMVRTDDGWAVGLRDAGGVWQVLVIDEASMKGRQYVIPGGEAVVGDGLLLQDDVLHLTTARAGQTTGVTVHSWYLEHDGVRSHALAEIPAATTPKGAYDGQLMLHAPRGLLAGDSSIWVLDNELLRLIESDGRVMDGAMVNGLLYLVVEQNNNWRVSMQSINGEFQYTIYSNDTVIGGIWGNDGHVAFNTIFDTSDPKGQRLWEIHTRTHDIQRMGFGWDVKFAGPTVTHLTRSEGTSPYVTEWSRNLQDSSEGVFLPDQPIWDVTDEGLWWMEAPRTDHRYPETPNPTPFVTMLMTSDR